MLRNIMVPLDGSAFAEQALPLALAIARRSEARLQLVAVRASLQLDTATAPAETYLEQIAGQLESELPGRITREVLASEFGPLEYPLARNTVADVLSRHAEEADVGLIVMTTHGRGGIKRAWLGSVADSLIRIAPRPVLLMRPQDEAFGSAAGADRGLKHILIPLDGSERAERVLEFAQQLGGAYGARYTLLRVVSPLTFTTAPEWYNSYTAMPITPLSVDSALQYVEQVAERLRRPDVRVDARAFESPGPESAIVDYATEHGVDLIAMSTGGAGGVRRLLLGSVADKVVRSSEIPVLVCNARVIDTAGGTTGTESAAMAGRV
ncbi:MAG TPA: universal stress protein [Longimicrobiales bacterium]